MLKVILVVGNLFIYLKKKDPVICHLFSSTLMVCRNSEVVFKKADFEGIEKYLYDGRAALLLSGCSVKLYKNCYHDPAVRTRYVCSTNDDDEI